MFTEVMFVVGIILVVMGTVLVIVGAAARRLQSRLDLGERGYKSQE